MRSQRSAPRPELEERAVRGTIRVAGGAAMLLHFPDDPAVRVTRRP